jgi:hypothetical protein
MKKFSKDPLQSLPGVGPASAADFRLLGINTPAELAGRNPQQLYDELCALTGQPQDRCVLYVFRCAIWVVENPDHPDKTLRNWWAWKDREHNEQPRRASARHEIHRGPLIEFPFSVQFLDIAAAGCESEHTKNDGGHSKTCHLASRTRQVGRI